MKSHVIWLCEFCHKQFDYAEDCEEHEATHYGLTFDEYQGWKRLRNIARNAGAKVGICKCPRTDKIFDEAIKNLTDFETSHELMDTRPPSHWN